MGAKAIKLQNKVKAIFKEIYGDYRCINVISASENGISDLIILADGIHYEIEIKGAGDVLSDLQLIHLIQCNRHSGIGLVITDDDLELLRNIINAVINNSNYTQYTKQIKYAPNDYETYLNHCRVDI